MHLAVEGDDLAVPGQQQRERVVGHLAHPDVGDVDDDHAQLGGRGDVDDVVAHPGPDHGLEAFERAHHAARDRRGRDHERVGVARARDHLVLGPDEGEGGHARGDVSERGLAIGVVALATALDGEAREGERSVMRAPSPTGEGVIVTDGARGSRARPPWPSTRGARACWRRAPR